MRSIHLLFLSGTLLLSPSFAQRGPAVVGRAAVPSAVIAGGQPAHFPWVAHRTMRSNGSGAAALWGAPVASMNPRLENDSCSCAAGAAQTLQQPSWPESEPLPLAPADPPARGVIHEYHWPATLGSAAAFAIVTKDGQVRRASAVWLMDGRLHFSGADGGEGSLKFEAIDTRSTRALNAEAGLTWPWEPR